MGRESDLKHEVLGYIVILRQQVQKVGDSSNWGETFLIIVFQEPVNRYVDKDYSLVIAGHFLSPLGVSSHRIYMLDLLNDFFTRGHYKF